MRAHTAHHTLLWGSNHILQCRLHGCLCNIPILFVLRIRTPVVAGGGQGRFPAAAVPFIVIVVDHILTVHHVKRPGDSTLQLAYRRWPTELLLLSQLSSDQSVKTPTFAFPALQPGDAQKARKKPSQTLNMDLSSSVRAQKRLARSGRIAGGTSRAAASAEKVLPMSLTAAAK